MSKYKQLHTRHRSGVVSPLLCLISSVCRRLSSAFSSGQPEKAGHQIGQAQIQGHAHQDHEQRLHSPGGDVVHHAGQVGDGHIAHHAGPLDQVDDRGLIGGLRHDHRLGQGHMEKRLPPAQPQGPGGLHLAGVHAHQRRAHDLGHIGRHVEGEGRHRHDVGGNLRPGEHHIVHQHQQHQHRRAPGDGYVQRRQAPEGLEPARPELAQQRPQQRARYDGQRRDLQRHPQARRQGGGVLAGKQDILKVLNKAHGFTPRAAPDRKAGWYNRVRFPPCPRGLRSYHWRYAS